MDSVLLHFSFNTKIHSAHGYQNPSLCLHHGNQATHYMQLTRLWRANEQYSTLWLQASASLGVLDTLLVVKLYPSVEQALLMSGGHKNPSRGKPLYPPTEKALVINKSEQTPQLTWSPCHWIKDPLSTTV